ncbi:MAG: hypothetical protein H8Z69_00400 [Nanohaloarchaea archaeon]|nr:hypothetical protein [Candidatus Nanohaloarchaea archaeon]
MIAVGSITIINQYKKEAFDTTREKQSINIANNVKRSMISLQNTNGSKTVDLPDRIAGGTYRLGLKDQIYVFTNFRNYSVGIESLDAIYDLQGSSPGGSVKIFKQGNKISLRSN